MSNKPADLTSNDTAIQLIDVNKWFGEFHVLKDINLTVERGERIVICGPSGSGKSTMIRCINRLEEHQRGQIVVDGTELTNDLKDIEIIRREVGMVNILAENEIVPELLQQDFTPERLAEEAILLLKDQDRRATMIGHLKQIRNLLGEPGAYQRAAQILVDQLKSA